MKTGARRELEGLRNGKPAAVRPGYTLVEMMLVLAVIGTLAAVAWPSVVRMQADHELSSAAEQVRQQLASSRTRAIKAGLKYQFRYEPQGRYFMVMPFEAEPEPAAGQGTSANSTAAANAAAAQHRVSGELPKKLTFQSAASQSTTIPPSQKLPVAAFQGLPNAEALAAASWSDPIIFAADGSAMDAVITLGDARGQRIDLSVRGLTGATVTSPMRREAAK